MRYCRVMVDLRSRRRPRTGSGLPSRTTEERTAATERAAFFGASVAWLIVAATLSFVFRLPFLTVPLITDEGGYAYVARRWLDGRGDLYGDLWFDRPQGIFLAYGLILHTLGTGEVAIRLGAWLVTLGTLVVIWAFAREAFNSRVANMAAVCFALIAGSPAIEGFTANAETFMALPAAGCAWSLWRASRKDWCGRTLVMAGLLAGIATLLKPSGGVMLPAGLFFAARVAESEIRTIVRRWWWLTFGFAIALAPAILHGWLTGWGDFAEAVTYRAHAHSGATETPVEQFHALRDLVRQVWPLLAAVALPLGVLCLSGLSSVRANWPSRKPGRMWQADAVLRLLARLPSVPVGREPAVLLRLWLIACLGGMAMGGHWFPHYLGQITAPLAIVLAALLSDTMLRLKAWAWCALLGLVFAALLYPYSIVVTTRGDTDEMSNRLFDRDTYPVQDELAAYLRSHTDPEEPVYVAFAQASIYYLADRPAAFRHIYMWELSESEGALVAMAESPDRPEYVVDMGQKPPWPDGGLAFAEAVEKHYHVETVIDGVVIYRANEGGSHPR